MIDTASAFPFPKQNSLDRENNYQRFDSFVGKHRVQNREELIHRDDQILDRLNPLVWLPEMERTNFPTLC